MPLPTKAEKIAALEHGLQLTVGDEEDAMAAKQEVATRLEYLRDREANLAGQRALIARVIAEKEEAKKAQGPKTGSKSSASAAVPNPDSSPPTREIGAVTDHTAITQTSTEPTEGRSRRNRTHVPTYNMGILSGGAVHTPAKYLHEHYRNVYRDAKDAPAVPTHTTRGDEVEAHIPKAEVGGDDAEGLVEDDEGSMGPDAGFFFVIGN